MDGNFPLIRFAVSGEFRIFAAQWRISGNAEVRPENGQSTGKGKYLEWGVRLASDPRFHAPKCHFC